jgi:hypothetical protein
MSNQNLIRNGAELLADLLKAHASEDVTYERTGLGTVVVPATFGVKRSRNTDEFGHTRLEWTDLDFIIPAADLVIVGQQIEPTRGDFIYVNQGLESRILQKYQVMPLGPQPPYVWSDPFLINYRIHTKLMEQAVVARAPEWVFAGARDSEQVDSDQIQAFDIKRLVITPIGNYEILGSGYKYICYPNDMGDILSINDAATGIPLPLAQDSTYSNITQSGIAYALVIVNIVGSGPILYRVFRSEHFMPAAISLDVVGGV